MNNLLYTTSFLLLLGVFDWPYEFYQLLRIIVFTVGLITSYGFYKSKYNGWMILFGIFAFIFNPLIPVFLSKNSWIIIDIISGLLFLIAGKSYNRIRSR